MNINRYILTLLLLIGLLVPLAAYAEGVEYPCRELMDNGKLGSSYNELKSMETHTPNDPTVAFAFYKWFALRDNPNRNVRKSYAWLCLSQDRLNALPAKDRTKAEKNGYTQQMYASEFANICLSAQLEAQRKNSIEGWNEFLRTYKRAPQKQLIQITKTRNAMAFKQAEKANTLDAYRQFVSAYPNALERQEATSRIYTLAYQAVANGGTEHECRQYITQYPESPYIPKVRDQIEGMEMHRLVRAYDWQTQKNYLLSHTAPSRWRDTTVCYFINYVGRTHAIDAAKWGIANLPRPQRDSCLAALRSVCMEDTTLQPLVKFYRTYREQVDDAVYKQDSRMLEAEELFRSNLLSANQYISRVAPAYPAYYQLQKLIKPDVKAKRWDEALTLVRSYQHVFRNDHRYADLLRVLEEKDDPKLVATSIGATVNTPDGNEFLPVVSADGKQLLFCGTKRQGNVGKEDIFFSQKTLRGWSKAEPVAELNTADANEAPLSLTADGSTMIVFRNGKLMLSHRTKDGWGELQPFLQDIAVSDWQADAMITSDGKALLFAAFCRSEHEEQMSVNIFVSQLQDNGEWGQPVGLGPMINTPRIDRSPFLHPDMRTLYFCSEGHGSLGGMDVFVSTRLNERSWQEWSAPVNLGKVINTAGNECWYKISTDGSFAYFSKRENKQNDLCQLTIPDNFRPQPVATIAGKITDPQGAPVVTMIRWEDLESQRLIGQTRTDPEDGSFFIVLPQGKNYGYYVSNDKLFPLADNIDLRHTHEFINVENNMTVASLQEMIDKEIPMPMNNLFFNTGEYVLLPPSIAELNRIAAIIRQQGRRVEISGHTDNVGDDEYNRALSENRANAVRNYLVKLGVNKNLLTTKGYGKTRPVESNDTPEGRQKNRRVELQFIK